MSDGATQLHPGAREALDALLDDVQAIVDAAGRIRRHTATVREKIRLNPLIAIEHTHHTDQRVDEIDEVAAHLLRSVKPRLQRLLQRRAELDAIDQARRDELAVMRANNLAVAALLAAHRPEATVIPFPSDRPA